MKDLSYLKNNIFSHRGLHNKMYPENTMGAFINSINKGIGIELDVHLLKDNTIVVFHDDNLNRMANINIKLKDSYYDDIKNIKLANSNYTIPKLEDVLNLIDGKVPVIVELKYDRKVGLLEEEVFKLLDNYKGWFCIKSFHPLHVRYVRKHRPNYIRGLLMIKKHSIQYVIASNSLLFRLIARPDFISCEKYLYKSLHIKRNKKSKPVIGWGVDNEEEMNFYKQHFDSIIFENKEEKL